MSRRQGRRTAGVCLMAIMAIFMAVLAANIHAQYNGECWAADYVSVYKIDSSGQAMQVQGFSQPLSLSINPADGSCWVADTDMVRVIKLSADGQQLLLLEGIFKTNPRSLAVDPRDGSCWVATIQSLHKFSSDGSKLASIEGFDEPVVDVSPLDGVCWVADSNNARIVRLSAAGQQLGEIQIDGVTQPKYISVNAKDGTCWVLDAFTLKAVRLSSDGTTLAETSVVPAGTAIMSTALSASPDGGCWVGVMVDTMNDSVIKLSADGKQALKVDGFGMPSGVASDPKDGGCWVADTNGGQVVKLSSAGQNVTGIANLTYPKVVTVASTSR